MPETSIGKKQALTKAGSALSALTAGFEAPPSLPNGFIPTAVVAGDFNEDGKPDLAVSNGGDNTIYVLLGDGFGGFGTPEVLYTVGSSPVWITTSKLRVTGHQDLVLVDGDSNQVEVFSGNGDGTFALPVVVATLKQTPTYITTADFDGDGNQDLGVGLVVDPNSLEPLFTILIGDGTGGFGGTLAIPSIDNESDDPLPTSALLVVDVNKSGHPSVVANAGGAGWSYLNQGSSGFSLQSQFSSIDGILGLAVADVDGDGCPDAIEAGSYGLLTIEKGTCDGNFTQSNPAAAVGDLDAYIVVADLDGDGKLDIATSGAFVDLGEGGIGAFGGYTISVMKGNGKGEFAPASIYRGYADQYSLIAIDLKGTGLPDLVATGSLDSQIVHLSNDGQGGYGAPSGETIGYVNAVSNAPVPGSPPLIGDLNGDGRPDVLLLEYGAGDNPPVLASLLNDGKGKLGPPIRSRTILATGQPNAIFTTGNFRSGKGPDVILVEQDTSPNDVSFAPGNSDGTFASPVVVGTVTSPQQVVTGDFDHDGKLDFAVIGPDENSNDEIDSFLGNGDGTFRHLPALIAPALVNWGEVAAQQLIAGDFNHDGKLDLLIGLNSNGGWTFSGDDLELALGNGDGTFNNPNTLIADFGPVAVGDLNHDGYLDLVQGHDPGQSATAKAVDASGPYLAPAATIFLGQKGGSFVKGATYVAPQVQYPTFFPPLLGDFNGDGNLDLALYYASPYATKEFQLEVLTGLGDGTFSPNGLAYGLPVYDKPQLGADFQGTGRTDLLDLIGATASINTISAGTPASVGISFDQLPIPSTGGTATVTLAVAATGSVTVALDASDTAVQLPSSVTFQAGETQAHFAYSIGEGFDRTHVLVIGATDSGYTANAYGALPNHNLSPGVVAEIGIPLATPSVSLSTSPGQQLDLVFSLHSIYGYGGNFSSPTCIGLPSGVSCSFVASELTLLPGRSTETAFTLTMSSSTALGIYPIQVVASNGDLSPSAMISLGVGDFVLSVNPTTINVDDGTMQPTAKITAKYNDGYNNAVNFSCEGLPANLGCYVTSVSPSQASTVVTLGQAGVSFLPAGGDYPFTIVGTDGIITQTLPMVARVSNFSATLSQTTLSAKSYVPVSVNVVLKSINDFVGNSIQISCVSQADIACSASPAPASLTAGGSTTVVLTINAAASATAANLSRPARANRVGTFYLALLLPCFGFIIRKRNHLLAFLCALILSIGIGSCGGGSSSQSSTSSGIPSGGSGSSGQPQTVTIQVLASSGLLLQNSAGTLTLSVTP